MVMKRVLIANKSYPAAGLELLKKKVECLIVPHLDHEPESLQEIKKQIKGVDAVIWNVKHKFTKEILDIAGPNLKAISTMSTGLDHIDQDAVKAHGVLIGNTPNVLNNSVADIAIGVMIAAARRFKEGVADLESGEWKYGVNWTLGQDIAGSTVGIVGLGSIGQAIVRRLKGFDVARFLYTGRSDKPEAISLGAERVSLDELLKASDYVMLGCPFTPETKHLINKEALNKMKRSAVLVNYARGEIVDQEALYEALKEKRIFASGLDVVTPEPLPKDHPLISLPNCFIVPHLGSATYATRNTMSTIAANNVLLALDGKPMQCPVNY